MEKEVENKNEKKEEIKERKTYKIRLLSVIIFLVLATIIAYISIKSSYLEYKDLGENYEEIFWTNTRFKYFTMGISFAILYIVMYFTNKGIKKGLKPFFETEKIDMPKLPNKSISLVFATIGSAIIGTTIMQKLILFMGNASFGIDGADPIFGLDVGYYMFQKPLLEFALIY